MDSSRGNEAFSDALADLDRVLSLAESYLANWDAASIASPDTWRILGPIKQLWVSRKIFQFLANGIPNGWINDHFVICDVGG